MCISDRDKGLQTSLIVDHDAVARLGLNQKLIDATSVSYTHLDVYKRQA